MKHNLKWKPLTVLFVGDQPSNKNVSKDLAFVGTPSYKRLLKWIGILDLDIKNVTLINSGSYIYKGLDLTAFNIIIYLGKKSYTNSIFKNCSIKTKIIDHPSPLNRKLNNLDYEKKMLKQLKSWLYD